MANYNMKQLLTLLVCLSFHTLLWANENGKPTKYKAKVYVLLYGEVEGNIYVNLYGENTSKIKIETLSVKESNGTSFTKRTETIETYTYSITYFVIDSVTYKFKNFKDGGKSYSNYCVSLPKDTAKTGFRIFANDTSLFFNIDKVTKGNYEYEYNCLSKKIYGVDSFAIYQWGFAENADKCFVVLPSRGTPEYRFVNHSFFTNSTVWSIALRSCKQLQQDIREKKEGWAMLESLTNEEKILLWKKYIDAWLECKNTK